MGDTETTKVILDINGNNAHKEMERQREMIKALEEDAVKIAQAFGTQSQQLKDIEAKIHRARKALQNYQSTCVELSEVMKKLDIANPRELEKTNKSLTAKLHDPTIDRNSTQMKEVLTQLGPIRQEIAKSNAEINAFMSTIKESGNMSVSELQKADRALKALLATQERDSEQWKETGKMIQNMTRELDKATAAQKKLIAGADDSPYGKSQQELTRMKSALEDTLRTQKQGTAEWMKTNDQLIAVNKELRQADVYAKEMSSGAWRSVDGKSREELVRMKTALKEVLDTQVQGSAEWNTTYQRIEKVSAAIDKVELETKKASKHALIDPKGLPLADLKKMESTLNDIIKREQQGSAEWTRANAKLREVKDEMYRLDIESKRAAVDVEKVLKNMSSANLSELRRTLEVLNKEINSPNIRRGSEEWNKYNAAIKQVTAEIRLLESESKETKSWIDRFNDGMNNWQTTIAAVAAAIFGLYQQLVEMRNFSFNKGDARAKLQAITGLDDKSVFWLQDQAKKLSTEMEETGMRVRQTSAEIMDAFRLTGSNKPELLKDREGLYETTKEVIRLSQASTMELQPATIALTTALNQFGEGADSARKYVNALAAGSKYGAADVENQTKVIVRSGVAARLAGLSFEDLVAATETLAETGLKGERAGTSMKTILTRMELGAKECRPSIVGLDKALENMASRANDVNWLKDTFGMWSYSAAKTLIDHRESLKKYRKAVTDTNVAEEQAAIMGKTNLSVHTQITNKFKELSDDLYEKVGPSILHVTSQMVNWTRTVKEVLNWILEHKNAIIALIAQYTALIAVMKMEMMVDKAMVLWNEKIVTGYKLIRAEMSKLKAAGGIWVAIASLVASAGIALHEYIKKSREAKNAEIEHEKALKQRIDETIDKNNKLYSKYIVWDQLLRNEQTSYKNKLALLKQLNKAIPEYNGVIDKNTKSVTGNIAAIEDWIKKQNALVVYNAHVEELMEATMRSNNAKKAVSEASENLRNKSAALNSSDNPTGYRENRFTYNGSTEVTQVKTKEGKEYEEALEAYNKAHNENVEAEKILKKIKDLVRDSIVEMEKVGAEFYTDLIHDQEINDQISEMEKLNKKDLTEKVKKAKLEAEREALKLKKERSEMLAKGIIDRDDYDENVYKIDLDLYQKYIDIMKQYYGKDTSEYEKALVDKENLIIKHNENIDKERIRNTKKAEKEDNEEIKKKKLNIDAVAKQQKAAAIKEKDLALAAGNDKEAVELKYQQKIFNIESNVLKKKRDLYDNSSEEWRNYNNQAILLQQEYLNKIQKKSFDIQNKLFAKQSSQYRAEIDLLDEALNKKLLAQEEYTKAVILLRKKESNAEFNEVQKQGIELNLKIRERVNNINKVYEENLAREKTLLEQGKITQEQYAENIKQLRIKKNDETYTVFQDKLKKWLNDYGVIIQQMQSMLSSYSSMVAANYDAQIQAVENRYDLEIAKAEKAGRDTTKLEKEKAIAVAEIQMKQAKAQHDADVAQALMNVAMTITQTYAQSGWMIGSVLAPMIAAMGAMQVATLNTQYQARKSALETSKNINAQYYEGGFTRGSRYRKEAGVVHEGEFVANHEAVNNPSIRPMLDLIDYAQRNNRVASLTSEDLAMANSYQRHGFASGGYSSPVINVAPPSVNMPSQDILINTMIRLSQQLDEGIHADVNITGNRGLEKQQKRYQQLLANKSRL